MSLQELVLQREFVMPLLAASGFRSVRENSGPGERGIDVVATLRELTTPLLCGFQIKRIRLSARAGKGLGAVLDQLGQLKRELVLDPVTLQHKPADRCWLVTPYPVPPEARTAFNERLAECRREGIQILDGESLLELAGEHKPELLARFSGAARYRISLGRSVARARETELALTIAAPFELDTVHVDAPLRLQPLMKERPRRIDLLEPVGLSVDQYKTIVETLQYSGYPPPAAVMRRMLADLTQGAEQRKLKLQLKIDRERAIQARRLGDADRVRTRLTIESGARERRVLTRRLAQLERDVAFRDERARTWSLAASQQPGTSVQLERLLGPFAAAIGRHVAASALLGELNPSEERVRQVVTSRLGVARALATVRDQVDESAAFIHHKCESVTAHCAVSHRAIASVHTNVFVLGKPGAGKTTLLRRMCAKAASSGSETLPVFLPLVDVEPTIENLTKRLADSITSHAYVVSVEFVREKLEKGELVLFLDGLDETGARASKMYRAVSQLAVDFPKCQIVFSCRDTFGFAEWPNAINVELDPLTEPLVEEFVSKWPHYQDQRQAGRLHSWLTENHYIRQAAATPLVCALLCSLASADADLPSTEIELYTGRLELLLGRWDRAKGIESLSTSSRRRYSQFLRALAFSLHVKEKRDCTLDAALAVADDYLGKGIGGASALIEDCVRRGVLERDGRGTISFGHLTYQEHLVGHWLADRNDVEKVLQVMTQPWWMKSLQVYASIKADIRELVLAGIKKSDLQQLDSIRALLAYAQDTPPRFVGELSRAGARTKLLRR